MKIEIRKSFEKDAKKLSAEVKVHLYKLIQQVKNAKDLSEIPVCKKLTGYKNAYRLRLGSFRVGVFYESGTVELVRVLNRKEIYKYFP